MFLLVGFTVLHVLFFIFLAHKWRRIPGFEPRGTHSNPGVTILVPVRNEEKRIKNTLESLIRQTYPGRLIQVLVIDDHSSDNTLDIVRGTDPQGLDIEILQLPAGKIGKKAASTLGVGHAKNGIILCTDGDCVLPQKWVENYVRLFETENPKMITGPVMMNGENTFSRLQSLEFSGLIGYGGITLHMGFPGMCNGANMAYRKHAFIEVDGYAGNQDIPSGDDEFLLQKINAKYPNQVKFMKSKESIVRTSGKRSFSALIDQRIRWTSKWKFHRSRFIKISAVTCFIDFVVGILLFPALFFLDPVMILALLFSRWISEWIYLHSTSTFLVGRSLFFGYFILSFIYPFYAFLLGIASIFGNYSWKGRNY